MNVSEMLHHLVTQKLQNIYVLKDGSEIMGLCLQTKDREIRVEAEDINMRSFKIDRADTQESAKWPEPTTIQGGLSGAPKRVSQTHAVEEGAVEAPPCTCKIINARTPSGIPTGGQYIEKCDKCAEVDKMWLEIMTNYVYTNSHGDEFCYYCGEEVHRNVADTAYVTHKWSCIVRRLYS